MSSRCPACQRPIERDSAVCPYCRAAIPPPEPAPAEPSVATAESLDDRVRALMASGKKIAAVKLYKDETGASLADAKGAVERLADLAPARAPSADDAELLRLLGRGQKLEAVKRYKQASGSSLLDAKKYVERLGESIGIRKRGIGCAGMALLAILSGIAALLTVS